MTLSKEAQAALFCHVHVSKTGGTSLNLLLERWFPGAFEVLHDPDPNFVVGIETIAHRLAQEPFLCCIATHHLKTFPSTIGGRRVHYFTILRDPLDRAISLLTFMKKSFHEFTEEHRRSLPSDFETTPELEILKRWTEETASAERSGKFPGNPITAMFLSDNFQCDFVKNRRACEAAAAASCVGVLDRFLYVGDFPRFRQSVEELARRIRAFGISACPIDDVPSERVSRDIRGDLQWLEDGRAIVDAYMDGLTIDGMVYRHFAERCRRPTET